MAEEIVGLEEFQRHEEGSADLKGSLVRDKLGPQARAMHDAGVVAPEPKPEKDPHISELHPGGTVQLEGSSILANLPETIDLKDRNKPSLFVTLGSLPLTITQHPSDYVADTTGENGPMGERRAQDKTPAHSFSIDVAGREVVVLFDQLDTEASMFTDRQAERVQQDLSELNQYLQSDEERHFLANFKDFLQEVAERSQAQAEDYQGRIKEVSDERTISLTIGREPSTEGPSLVITPSVEDAHLGTTVHLIELVRDRKDSPRRAVDITDEGLRIPMPIDSTLSTVSKVSHASLKFTGDNNITVQDGNGEKASTNGTTVTRL